MLLKFKVERVFMTLHNDRFLVKKHFLSCDNEQFLILPAVDDTLFSCRNQQFLIVPQLLMTQKTIQWNCNLELQLSYLTILNICCLKF